MKTRILLAEGNQGDRSALAGLLSSAGYHVSTAENGKDALQRCEEECPDLVIMGVQLPLMNGIESAAQIRRNEKIRHIPILFTSAPGNGLVSHENKLDMVKEDLFLKPVDQEKFVSRIKATIRVKSLYDELLEAKEALRKSEEKYRLLVETTDTGYTILDAQGRVLDANSEYVRLTGHLSIDEILGRHVAEWTAEHDSERILMELVNCSETGMIRGLEVDYVGKGGRTITVEMNATVLVTEEGERIMSLCRDITRRKKTEKILKESEEKFKCIFDYASDGIYIIDLKQKKTQMYNTMFCKMLGYTPEEMSRIGVHDIHPEESMPFVLNQIDKLTKGEISQVQDIPVKRKDGSMFYADIDASTITLGGKKYLMGIFRDITGRRNLEEKLRKTSITDELTGLYNRRGFFAIANKQWQIANRNQIVLSLIFLDLDGLKLINDKYGHQAGDTALMDTASILKIIFRESDIIGRIGGDEFAVMLFNVKQADFDEAVKNHLERQLEKHNEKEDRPFSLSLSFGIAHYDPRIHCTLDEFCSHADSLMYENKKRKFTKYLKKLRKRK